MCCYCCCWKDFLRNECLQYDDQLRRLCERASDDALCLMHGLNAARRQTVWEK